MKREPVGERQRETNTHTDRQRKRRLYGSGIERQTASGQRY